jgi:hypothetical protein
LSSPSPALPGLGSPDVRPFPAHASPPVLRPLLTPARSTTASRHCSSAPHWTRHPDRPPRIRTAAFPLLPPRLREAPLGGNGLCRMRPAHPGPPASYAVSHSSVQGFASGFLPTPPRDDAVASDSELAPPLPPEDFHLLATAHAGRTSYGRSESALSCNACLVPPREGEGDLCPYEAVDD